VTVADDSVSREHFELVLSEDGEILIEDLGSHNGTFVDGRLADGPTELGLDTIVQAGDVEFRVRLGRGDDHPLAVDPRIYAGPTGTIPFNRPPRSAAPKPLPPLTVPTAPGTSTKAPFNVAALIAPLVFGAVMVIALKNVLFGLFAVLSPVMLIGNWYESRFRNKRSLRRETREYTAALRRLDGVLAERHKAEIARRRGALPDLAEACRQASLPSIHLWERRSQDDDFMLLSAGFGNLPWRPQVTGEPTQGDLADEVSQLLADHETLPLVPVTVNLSAGDVVGIVGTREPSLALARALVAQAATFHGPADLAIAVASSHEHARSWDWIKWLPHTQDPRDDGRLLGANHEESMELLADLLANRGGPAGRALTLVVVDDERLTEGRNAAGRMVLQRPPDGGDALTAGIVIATSEDRLPAVCNTVIALDEVGATASLRRPQQGEKLDGFLVAGTSEETARAQARALARFEDPELDTPGLGLPEVVPLPAILGLSDFDPETIRRRWSVERPDGDAGGVIGVAENGPCRVDLDGDGPHALIGGMTGSGKSELLRTLVLSMSSESDPEHLTFVLIDFKGGATFSGLDRLPHTVGLATDLDEQLTERALQCLRAELTYRERLFAEAGGVDDLKEYRERLSQASPSRPLEQLPRLVVIVDEFAEMIGALPDFLKSLDGIAHRGRSLGVHLFLATQRPAGVVNAEIRSNTDLWIALRVQEGTDSTDVIGVPDAAAINKAHSGRAYVRRASTPPELIQTAFASGSWNENHETVVTARRFVFARTSAALTREQALERPTGPTDLTRLVDAINDAYEAEKHESPRRPWTDPLPPVVPLDTILPRRDDAPGQVPIALLDDPDHQAQYPWSWDLQRGNLLLYGITGSGTTSALAAIAIALASTSPPDELHMYVLDYGAGELTALARLPQVGTVVGAADRQRQIRLVRQLRGDLERRKDMEPAARSAEPRLVLLIDNFAAFNAEFGDLTGLGIAEELERVYADGPELGIHIAVAADRAGAIRGPMSAVTEQKLVFRLSDPQDYGLFGLLRKQIPAFTPGCAVALPSAHVIQVGWPGSLASAVAGIVTPAPRSERRAQPIEVLPSEVDSASLLDHASLEAHPWRLPIGIGNSTLTAASFQVFEGDHMVIAGPPRAGKSSVLEVMAFVAKRARPEIMVSAIALRGSPLRGASGIDHLATSREDIAAVLDRIAGDTDAQLVLIDDADGLDDADGRIARLLSAERNNVHIAIAARADALRRLYGHWTQTIRRSRLGLLLRPDLDLDGDLLGVVLPRRQSLPATVGRGYLVCGGDIELVQAARCAS
jgi:S-DNA-T family DNA segregation ATPase FtsK/SpoIIIE